MEERLREALGDKAFKALRWYVSRETGIDIVEALTRGYVKEVKEALERFFKSSYAAELLLRIAGVEG